jgi:arabinose-5-phosphate isomerase
MIESEPGTGGRALAHAGEEVHTALDAGRAALACIAGDVSAAVDRFGENGAALAVLLDSTGRVVVTGLGKSGLIGAKFAATLASTGTPALFVHAADALHGDAGMVCDGDVLVAISNSGSTAEVVRFAEIVAARGARVLAMTGCGGASPLCQLAHATVDIGVPCEADPFDLVPTSSSAVTLAVADALAVGLMIARGFGPEDFHRHHPGGALGSRLGS